MIPLPVVIIALIAAKSDVVIGNEVRIKNEKECFTFSSNVNGGTNYYGTTVFLDSDLSLRDVSKPIGTNTSENYHFRGTIDGQGHVISNLKVTTSSAIYTGVFGYSSGLTIKNFVLDDSCSIKSSYTSSNDLYLGGIIGLCESSKGECIFENIVNMASVTFSGTISSNALHIGGIVGSLIHSDSSSSIFVRNCANYGNVTQTGGSKNSYIGGIVGYIYQSSETKYIHNCFNYGTITHSGSTSSVLNMGGIAGLSYYAQVQNSLSAGKISSSSGTNYIGAIVGYSESGTELYSCYYTSDTNLNKLYGGGTIVSTSGSTDSPLSANSALIGYLNSNESPNDKWNKWVLNTKNDVVTFKVNENDGYSLSSQIVLLPDLAQTGINIFKGWFANSNYSSFSTPEEVTSKITLYGLYGGVIAVKFKVSDATPSQDTKYVLCGKKYGTLPTVEKIGHSVEWFTEEGGEGDKITENTSVTISYDHTLYASWTVNQYKLTFDFNNGTEPVVRSLNYGAPIDYPKDVQREGYSFEWDNDIEYMPANDLIITVQWSINSYKLTFIIIENNWTVDERTVAFNETIVRPNNPVRDGYEFIGWDNLITKMPAHDLNITARWRKLKNNAPVLIAVGVVVPLLVIMFALIGIALFLYIKRRNDNYERRSYMKRKTVPKTIPSKKIVEARTLKTKTFNSNSSNNNDGDSLNEPLIDDISNEVPINEYFRAVSAPDDEMESASPAAVKQSVFTRLYPSDYTRPTMKEALLQAEFTTKRIKLICDACENAAYFAMDEGRLFEGFTEADAAAIAMYTYDFGPKEFEYNPYRILNRSLAERSYADLQKASGIMYLVMTALRKMSRVTGTTLYRGVRGEINKDTYVKGNVVTWLGLSSASPDMGTTKKFLTKGSKTGKSEGTLFIIEDGWGYNIQPYSLFPDEVEILIEPDRQFKVVSIIQGALTIVNLQMLDTPITLPQVFGSDW